MPRIESGQLSLDREEVDVLAAARAVSADLAAAAPRPPVSVQVEGTPERLVTDPMRLGPGAHQPGRQRASATTARGAASRVSVAPPTTARSRSVSRTLASASPPPRCPLVFQRFYRVRRGPATAEGGKGLGLAIVKHLVRALGGTVQLVSEEGRGTTVTVVLPTE